MLVFSFYLLLLINIAEMKASEEGAEAIGVARAEAEVRASEALEQADPSVLASVRAELARLEAAGRDDLLAIGQFQGPGDKTKATADSINYWRGRMDDYIQPFIQHPQDYKNAKFSDKGPAEPDNASEEYLKAVRDIDSEVQEAYKYLEQRYSELTAGKARPQRVEEVTRYNARLGAAQEALGAAKSDLYRHGQYSKAWAARGEAQIGLSRLRNEIQAIKSNFHSNIQDIYS